MHLTRSGTKHRLQPLSETPTDIEDTTMDKDRIKGATDQAKGSIKEAAGKVTGDSKLQAKGTLDNAKGKVESAIGGAKDSIRNNV